jgi:predicted dehydrogenase
MEPAVAAARAGKHVVVEKPLEITLDRCDRIIAACDQHQVKLCTIFPSRFADANVELKKAIAAQRFGRLTLGETACKWWRPQSYYDEGGWKGTQALDGGGALMNQAIHNVDLLQWLMGMPAQIAGFTAMLAHERIEVEDTAVACLRFQNGALGVIQATTSVHPADQAIRQRFAQKTGASGGASNPAAISYEYHRRQLADFALAIEQDRPPQVDGREGRKAVQIILGIYESAKTGRAVDLR